MRKQHLSYENVNYSISNFGSCSSKRETIPSEWAIKIISQKQTIPWPKLKTTKNQTSISKLITGNQNLSNTNPSKNWVLQCFETLAVPLKLRLFTSCYLITDISKEKNQWRWYEDTFREYEFWFITDHCLIYN